MSSTVTHLSFVVRGVSSHSFIFTCIRGKMSLISSIPSQHNYLFLSAGR